MSPSDLVATVCASRSVTVESMRGPGRGGWLAHTRRLIAVGLREMGMPLATIGECIGRDHKTVMYLLRTMPKEAA